MHAHGINIVLPCPIPATTKKQTNKQQQRKPSRSKICNNYRILFFYDKRANYKSIVKWWGNISCMSRLIFLKLCLLTDFFCDTVLYCSKVCVCIYREYWFLKRYNNQTDTRENYMYVWRQLTLTAQWKTYYKYNFEYVDFTSGMPALLFNLWSCLINRIKYKSSITVLQFFITPDPYLSKFQPISYNVIN